MRWLIRMRDQWFGPPRRPKDLDSATFNELKRYAIYLMKTLRRLGRRTDLEPDDRRRVFERVDYIKDMLGSHPLLADLVRTIQDTENRTLHPLLKRIGERPQPIDGPEERVPPRTGGRGR